MIAFQNAIKSLKILPVPIQIIHHEEEDPDMASDDEGFRFEGGGFSAEAGFPFGAPFINIAPGRNVPPVFISRRSRSGMFYAQISVNIALRKAQIMKIKYLVVLAMPTFHLRRP